MVVQGIKDIFPSLPAEIKDSISFKKTWQEDGYSDVQKEIFVWVLNYEMGTFQLPSRWIADLKALLAIPSTRRGIAVPKLRLLIRKLCSMHLAVLGSIGHFFYIQEALTKAGTGTRAYLSKAFHRERSHWKQIFSD